MAIPLNKDLVRRLIGQRFGSVDALVVEWEERVASGRQRVGRARDRSTVYRWIEKGLPSKQDDVFGFAGVLDVDPVGILAIDAIIDERTFEKRFYGKPVPQSFRCVVHSSDTGLVHDLPICVSALTCKKVQKAVPH